MNRAAYEAVRIGLFGLAATMFFALPAAAQRLWSVEEVTTRPLFPIEVAGVVESAATAAGAGPTTVEAATVQVEFDYLRLGMGYLELPLMDGSVIAAENAVFKDRGNGNFLWTGEVPGAGYESVLFTVQDGHLVGWFGKPGGPKYVVYAGPDGRGSLAEEVGPVGDWCGVEAGPEGMLHAAVGRADLPVSVASHSSDNPPLDILVLYTTGAERFWRLIGGPAVGLQQYSDYLNMIFRNGALPTTANLIAVRWDPELANRPSVNGYHQQHRGEGLWVWHSERYNSPEVWRQRMLHKADMVYFLAWTRLSPFTDLLGWNFGAGSLRSTMEPAVHWGWNVVDYLGAFPHEIGHMLGGWHEPAQLGEFFEDARSKAVRPYAFGHTDLTSCRKRDGFGDVLVCPRTTMSYGVETWDDPLRTSVWEPFYSSVRHKPNGWTIGVAGTSEVERVLHATVPVAVQSGEAPRRAEQYPRRVIDAYWTGRDAVRVAWSEDWRSQDAGRIRLALADGANDVYSWSWDSQSNRDDPRLDEEYSDPNVRPVVRPGGVQVGAEISGLRPGGHYRMTVEGPSRWVAEGAPAIQALASDVFVLEAQGHSSGSLAAASNIGARVTGPDSVRLHWRDNSGVDTGYEVWYRKWSGEGPDEVWRRYGEPLPALARHVDVRGLAAEEEIEVTDRYWDDEKGVWVEGQNAKVGRYSFVVVGFNDEGWTASETFHLEFMPGPHPDRRQSEEGVDCRVWSRPTGIDLDGHRVHACLETPGGARQRMWDYRLEADQSGLLYFSDRDDAEILVKVLDGCSVNGHRWVFVAPVTALPFRLAIRELGPYVPNRRQVWLYDSERRPQEEIAYLRDGNPAGRTARTVSDVTAFPCAPAEIAAAKADSVAPAPASLLSGAETDCEPSAPALTLSGGYRVSMCYETENGEAGAASDWGLESSRMGLLYFSDRDLVDALIKVRDDCAVGGNVSVSVAPATTAAFNLRVESPNGYVWRHSNRLGETADAVSDVSAFPCTGSPPEALVCTGVTCLLQGERFRVKAWHSKGGSPSQKAGAIAVALGASAGLFGGDSADPELLVRIVNRCRASGWWEVHGGVASDSDFRFAIRDTKTNALKWFRSSGRSVVDTEAFACTENDFGAMAGGAPADPGAACTGATCLLWDRLFRVKSWYRLDSGSSGPAAAVSVDLGGSAGLYAFESGNPELLVRVADTCSTTGYWTVYAGAASDAAFSVAIRDTGTNELKWFRSRAGGTVADTTAFACR